MVVAGGVMANGFVVIVVIVIGVVSLTANSGQSSLGDKMMGSHVGDVSFGLLCIVFI